MANAINIQKAASLQHKVLKMMRSDPKKTGVLTLLVVVLIVMWSRMWSSNGGATVAVAGIQGIPSALSSQSAANKSSEIHAALYTWQNTEIPIALNRNLFSAKLDYFPASVTAPAVLLQAAVPAGDGFWDRIEKSMSEAADQNRVQRVLTANLQAQIDTLRLETTLMTSKPRAVIDGALVGVGDVVASGSGSSRTEFRVVKIEARRVIVEREGIKLEIPMK